LGTVGCLRRVPIVGAWPDSTGVEPPVTFWYTRCFLLVLLRLTVVVSDSLRWSLLPVCHYKRCIGFPSVAPGSHLYGAAPPPIRCLAPVAAGAGNCGVSPDVASRSGLAGCGLLPGGWMDGCKGLDALGNPHSSYSIYHPLPVLCSYHYCSFCGSHTTTAVISFACCCLCVLARL
jgi:hypothetical protein